ncbi:MAG TPA: hypothetical protein VNU74_04085 [Terriglobales bacterium]|jgi:hypothetical protein|nr:hypothetical protein [Terriglobales bacterium]
MNCFLVVLLSYAVAGAQTAPTPTPPAHSAQSSINLNDSDNARQARAVLDKSIEALGGQPYLTYENRVEEGRYYPLYHGHTNSTGIPYRYYLQYPDKDRFEVIRTKDIHLLPGTIDIGGVKVKNKFDLALIHNGDKGYEITYKGTAAQEKLDLENYLRRRDHSLEWVFRKWMRDPNVALFYEGLAVVDGKETEGVTLLNSQNDSVSIYLDQNSHYPVKISYSWRDPKDKQKNTEDEVYDGYKLEQGIWTPHSITRYYNGESSQQRFINTASYNLKLPDTMFEAAVTYDPKAPMKSH